MNSLITTNLKQVNVLIDAWVQRLRDLAPDLVDSPCWEYKPNGTKSYDGFWAWTDGGGIFEGLLNCNDANSGSIGAWSDRMYEYARDYAKDCAEEDSEEYFDAIEEWEADEDLRIKFQCFFYDSVKNLKLLISKRVWTNYG